MFSSSRNNPIPREDEPNLHPAALNFSSMKRALESEAAEERPQRPCVCVCLCVSVCVCVSVNPHLTCTDILTQADEKTDATTYRTQFFFTQKTQHTFYLHLYLHLINPNYSFVLFRHLQMK